MLKPSTTHVPFRHHADSTLCRPILTLQLGCALWQEVMFSFELVNSGVARPANNVTLACGISESQTGGGANSTDGTKSSNGTNRTNSTNGTDDSGYGAAFGTCAPVAFPPRTAVAAAMRVRDISAPLCAKARAFGPPACTGICQGIVAGGACLCPPRRFGEDCGRTFDPDLARSTTSLVRGGAAAAVVGSTGDGVEIPAGGLLRDALVSVEVYPAMPELGPGQVSW
jgi:hypothetical protein